MVRFYWSPFAHFKKEKNPQTWRLVSSLEEKLKWNILFLSRYQDLHLFLLFLCLSPFLPVITSFSVLEGMILTLFDPPRIFTPTKLNFSILRCFTSSFRTEGSNTTWKPFILSQISTYKRTWNDLILWSFTDFIPDAFHFIDSPKTSISFFNNL